MTSSQTTIREWRLLNCIDAATVFKRFKARIRLLKAGKSGLRDPLLSSMCDRSMSRKGTWPIGTWNDLIRVTGALQFLNPHLSLWYRGQGHYSGEYQLVPSRYREEADWSASNYAYNWVVKEGERSDLLRRLTPIARLAVLQHYGIPTSFIDVSRKLEMAASMAMWKHRPRQGRLSDRKAWALRPAGDRRLLIIATPRVIRPVHDLPEADAVAVDLMAEMPSQCLRPHVQWAGFVGRRRSVAHDLAILTAHPMGDELVSEGEPKGVHAMDSLCIATISLEMGWDTVQKEGVFHPHQYFPTQSGGCALCGKRTIMMNGDFLLHVLKCLQRREKGQGRTRKPMVRIS